MNELKDRYVGAVLRAIPEDQRSDVDTELRAAIEDAIDSRVETGENSSEAEVAVLTDLGDPDLLAAQYTGRPLWVLGPRYYLAWLRVVRRLLTFVPALVGVVSAVIRFVVDGNPVEALLGGVWTGVMAVIHVLFWTTLGFVVAERVEYSGEMQVIPMGKWKVDYLPRVPDHQIGVVETIGALVIQLLVAVVLLAVLSSPELPILNPELWDLAIPAALGLMVVSLGFSLFKLRARRWTRGMAIFNGLLNLSFALLWLRVLTVTGVLNPDFVAERSIDDWLVPAGVITAATIAAICVWDTIDGFSKARDALSGRPVEDC